MSQELKEKFLKEMIEGKPINGGVPFEFLDDGTVRMNYDEILIVTDPNNGPVRVIFRLKGVELQHIHIAGTVSPGDTITLTGFKGTISDVTLS